MASGPITSWEIDGETVETVSDFIFWGSKITADGDCSQEIKRRLLFGRKVMTNLDSILKSRDITLPTKVRLVKATVFPVVMYGCESWTVKKAERRRIDAFIYLFIFIHFEFIFVYGVRKCSSFILLQVVDQFSQHHLLKRLSLLHCIFLPPLSKIRCP